LFAVIQKSIQSDVMCVDSNSSSPTVTTFCLEQMTEVEEDLKRKDLILLTSPCYVVGPAAALSDAQSIVNASVSKNFSPDSETKKDAFSFHIPVVGLTVHVRQGMLQLL